MAETRRFDETAQSSASMPGMDPLPPPSNTLPGMPEGDNLPPPAQSGQAANRPLTRAAQSAGTALGTTVNRVRTRLTVVRGGQGSSVSDEVSAKAREYSQTASRKLQDLKQDAQQRGEHLAETVQEKTAALNADVRQRLRNLRAQSQRVQLDFPIQVILGCAAAAFLLGFSLRIWRSGRD